MAADAVPPLLRKENLLRLFPFAHTLAAEAGTSKKRPSLDCDPSYIPMASGSDMPGAHLLVIDVGGTHTRCAVRVTDASGDSDWELLDDILNDDLKGKTSGSPLDRMFGALAPIVAQTLYQKGIEKGGVNGIGLIWSNKLSSKPLKAANGIAGVTGKIHGIGEGTSYRKGEWFTENIKDGDDVGGSCVEAFRLSGISPSAFVIGNDTIATGNAITGADAGMVASTGANVTIIPAGGTFFHNSEAGGNFEIPSEYLHGIRSPDCPGVKLEDAIAGVGLPGIFSQFLCLSSGNIPALQKPAAFLSRRNELDKWRYFRPHDLSALLNNDFAAFIKGKDPVFYSEDALPLLRSLAAEVIETGGRLAAVMAYISICNQLAEKNDFLIALDSNMARMMKGYLRAMQDTLDSVLGPGGKTVKLALIEPIGKISPPMIGAARSVNHFLEI